jgi:hypothetical protein
MPTTYIKVPCPDCELPVKVPQDATEDDMIECGNCGAVGSGDFWLGLLDEED